MKLNYYKRRILLDLYQSSKGLELFTFYIRYNIPPFVLGDFVSELVNKEFATENDGAIAISTNGREWIETNQKYLASEFEKPWRKIPKELTDQQLEVNKPYIPNMLLLDKDHFDL